MRLYINVLYTVAVLVCCSLLFTVYMMSRLPESRKRMRYFNATLPVQLMSGFDEKNSKILMLQSEVIRLKQQCQSTIQEVPAEQNVVRQQTNSQILHLKRLKQQVDEIGLMVKAAVKGDELATPQGRVVFLQRFMEQQNELTAQSLRLASVDGADQWNRATLARLTKEVQQQLYRLQYPTDCAKSQKLLCYLNKGCGFGCQLHHVVNCFQVAFFTGRLMVLQDHPWSYSPRGWESIFLPVTNCSLTADTVVHAYNGHQDDQYQVVSLSIIDNLDAGAISDILPLNYPQELSPWLDLLHTTPAAWWIGQMVTFLTRYQYDMNAALQQVSIDLNLTYPMVGVHVRRTDKINTEASFHSIDEYMIEVDRWYDIQLLKDPNFLGDFKRRRVYLASDDPGVLEMAKQKFPAYQFYGNKPAASIQQRYSDASLHGIVTDIHFLGLCDYLVCTFSSQVCRVAYERQQVLRNENGDTVYSLDDIYYFGGQLEHYHQAVMNHVPHGDKEMALMRGDLIKIAGNEKNGYSIGTNLRTGEKGLYPSYKSVDEFRHAQSPYQWTDTLRAAVSV